MQTSAAKPAGGEKSTRGLLSSGPGGHKPNRFPAQAERAVYDRHTDQTGHKEALLRADRDAKSPPRTSAPWYSITSGGHGRAALLKAPPSRNRTERPRSAPFRPIVPRNQLFAKTQIDIVTSAIHHNIPLL